MLKKMQDYFNKRTKLNLSVYVVQGFLLYNPVAVDPCVYWKLLLILSILKITLYNIKGK